MHAGTAAGPELVTDPLLKEIWDYRERYAAKFGYDLHAMCQDLRKREKASGKKLSDRRIQKANEP
jgi:hypothetical protein